MSVTPPDTVPSRAPILPPQNPQPSTKSSTVTVSVILTGLVVVAGAFLAGYGLGQGNATAAPTPAPTVTVATPGTTVTVTAPPEDGSGDASADPVAATGSDSGGAQTAETVTARDLAKIVKDPDGHVGQALVVYGEVFQFDSATGDGAFLGTIAHKDTTEYGYFDGDNAMLLGDPTALADVVKGDVFRAEVVVDGALTYDTSIGGSATVPQFTIRTIKVIGSNA